MLFKVQVRLLKVNPNLSALFLSIATCVMLCLSGKCQLIEQKGKPCPFLCFAIRMSP